MEALLLLSLAALAGLSLLYRGQRARLQARDADLQQRAEEIRALKETLAAREHEAATSQALWSALVDAAFDPILLLNEELEILHCNQEAQNIVEIERPLGMRIDRALASPELYSLAAVARRERESLVEQLVIGGANYRARIHVATMPGGQSYIGIALQDITELVTLTRARRDLVANISHELRTPITRIRLIIESLFLDADKPKRKASIQSLKEIAMETDALLRLAQELLDLSMIESGQAILRLVRTPLKPAVDDAIQRLQAQTEAKSLTVACHVSPRLEVLSDPDQLKRVLDNLLHNAAKWSPNNGAITITASELDDEITVSVLDSGPGVSDDLLQRIFERFYQADVSHSSDAGTGLGLAICKHIVEAHGGRIWAESNRRGNGGHFLFTLLKADAAAEPAASISRSPAREGAVVAQLS